MAICCYPLAQNTTCSLLTPTSNTSKSTKTSGRTQDPKFWNLINYLIIQQHDLSADLLTTRAMRKPTPELIMLSSSQQANYE